MIFILKVLFMRNIRIVQSYTNRESASFDAYLSEINKYPLLSIDEETALAERSKNGDLLARQKLIESNLRFVVSVAKQYNSKIHSTLDLVNEGNYWLINAAQRFDPSKWFKFISYAVWWIRKAILKAILEEGAFVRKPQSVDSNMNKVSKVIEHYLQKHQIPPTEAQIQDVLELPASVISSAMDGLNMSIHSYDVPLGDEPWSNTFEDYLVGEESSDLEIQKDGLNQFLYHAIDRLPPEWQFVIKQKYGLNDLSCPYNDAQIAQMLWKTTAFVSKISRKAIFHLKSYAATQRITKDILSVLQ